MKKDIDFYGPHLKAERAKQHIAELKAVFEGYVRVNEEALRPKDDPLQGRGFHIGGNFPEHTPTILGDALHNLRAALDHAYCLLVEAADGTLNRHSKFPFTEKGTRQDLEGSVKGHAESGNAPSEAIIAVIFDEIQPYPGGKGEDLIKLHVLDIADKHTVLLPTQQHTQIEGMRFISGSSIAGITLITHNAPAVEGGVGAGLDPKYDNKATFEICFGNGQPFEGQPVLPILDGLAARVDETLLLLEQRAKETP